MTTKMIMGRDINGQIDYSLTFPTIEDNFNTTLSLSTPQSINVPTRHERYCAVFSYDTGGDVWVANNATAALPGVSFAASASQHNPVARVVKRGDTLSFITSNSTCTVGVTFYALQ